MIKELLLNQLSAVINRLLATDPLLLEDLQPLLGKTLLIQCHPLKTPIYVLLCASGIHLSTQHNGTVTVSLSGKLADLLKFAKSPDQTKMLMDEHVKIHGELDFLLKLKRIATRADLDIEGLLANYIGDTAAVRLHRFAKNAVQKARTAAASFAKSTTLYLTEESQLLATPIEVEHFILEVNQLRQDLERACARSHRLAQGKHHGAS